MGAKLQTPRYLHGFPEAVKGGKLRIQTISSRIVKPGLAIEDGITEVVPPDDAPPGWRRTIQECNLRTWKGL